MELIVILIEFMILLLFLLFTLCFAKIRNKSICGIIFIYLTKNWKNLRLFAYFNRSIFEIFFLLLYTLEQAALIYITSHNKLTSEIVSYFALIVLLTFGFHKMLMESRIRILESDYKTLRDKTLFKLEQGDEENKRIDRILTKIENNIKK